MKLTKLMEDIEEFTFNEIERLKYKFKEQLAWMKLTYVEEIEDLQEMLSKSARDATLALAYE